MNGQTVSRDLNPFSKITRMPVDIHNSVLRGKTGLIIKSLIGDRLHQKLWAYPKLGYWPSIRNPRTFNEKILHRKLYTHETNFALLEDKWESRKYVEDRVGNNILPEVYHVTESPESIPFGNLPDEFVIKPTHLSGHVIVINEDDDVEQDMIIQSSKSWLTKQHGDVVGEYWYDQITPRIMVEELLRDESGSIPIDYKFLVFHGRVEAIHVTLDRYSEDKTTRNFYDRNWNELDVELFFDKGSGISEPENLDEMIQIAETLGEDFDHIRVDLYSLAQDNLKFGELTVAEGGGTNPFKPREYDYIFGELW